MSFRYRRSSSTKKGEDWIIKDVTHSPRKTVPSKKGEDWIIKDVTHSPRKIVPTIPEPRKHRFKFCSAIAFFSILLTIVATATILIQGFEKNVWPFVLLAKQEKSFKPNEIQVQIESKENISSPVPREEALYIEDLVLLPDEVLLMVHLPSETSTALRDRSMIVCVYSDQIITQVNGIEYLHGRAAVRCQLPEEKEQESSKGYARKFLSLSLLDRDLNRHIRQINHPETVFKWGFLVYESLSTSTDVVLFAKGVNHRQGMNTDPESLHCVFNGTVETDVTVSSQEVFRCKHPQKAYRSELLGTKISLRWHGGLIPSVAYYELPKDQQTENDLRHREVLCSCTMVFNVAKFLKEWVTYHSHLGVGHFFLYDNNSEDNMEETVAGLGGEFNVSRHPWPWIKTQEAGFSHCALLARNRCQWMLFADVDEFIFSPGWSDHLQEDTQIFKEDTQFIKESNKTTQFFKEGIQIIKESNTTTQIFREGTQFIKESNKTTQIFREGTQFNKEANKTRSRSNPSQAGKRALKSLVTERNNNNEEYDSGGQIQVGQISIKCNNFGPSGHKVHPERGVTQGYTCREKGQQRHKSMVLLAALPPSLLNVIHHFQLKPGYRTEHLNLSQAVINHYKYQAWNEFKSKFRRRVSAYVVDWKEARNTESQDRTPGLGKEAIEPPQWENRFCEVNDTALRDFAFSVFSSGSKMLWQL